MSNVKIAVGVGYEFIIIPRKMVLDIALQNTGMTLSVNGTEYALYKGFEYADSRKIDAIMDGPTHPKIYKTSKHLV